MKFIKILTQRNTTFMITSLLTVTSNSLRFFTAKLVSLPILILVFFVFGTTSQTNAQCIGPYARYESSITATGFTYTSATPFVNLNTAQSRSGAAVFQHATTNSDATIVFPVINNPKTVSLYVRKTAGPGIQMAYSMQFSTDGGANWYAVLAGTNTINGISVTGVTPILPTSGGLSSWDLVSATFNVNVASCLIRIKDDRITGVVGGLWFDDISWVCNKADGTASTGFPENTVVVPARVGTSALTNCTGGTVTVDPTAVYNFYDNGGDSDGYNFTQANQVTFTPSPAGFTAGDRIRIQFLSYTGAAVDQIEVWDNNGTTLNATTNLLTHTATTIPSIPTYISTIASDGSLTIKFTSDGLTNAAGFNIKVDCVRCPIPTGLAASAVTGTTATLTWNTTSAGAYDIYYNTTGTLPNGYIAPTVSNIGTNTASLSSLIPGATYYVWVRSRCGSAPDSYSPWSPSISFITSDCSAFVVATQPSTATQSLCQNAAATTLTVAASGGTVNTYQWYSNTTASSTGATLVGTNSASYTPVTTAVGTLYYYCVITSTTSCVIITAFSGAVTISTAPSSPSPSAGTGATATSIIANWVASSGATGYFLDVATDFGFTAFVYTNVSVGNVLTYTVTGLASGTTYYYRVRASNTCGTSANLGVITYATLSLAYCMPPAPATTTTYVNNFSTTGGITNISNLGTGFTTGGYANYSAQSCSQYPSSSISYSITSVRTDSTDQTFFYYIWVDWNNDGDFVDAGETQLATTTYQAGPFTGSFAVPAAQVAGSYRMRISTSWVGANTSCAVNASGRGEFEDYTITVVSVPPCVSSTPSALTSSSISGATAVISWTDAAMTPNSIYNYYYSTSNTAPLVGTTPSGTVTGANSASLTGLTLGNTYYFWVRSNCGTPSAWVGSSNFTTVNVDIINMTNGSSTTCNGRFFDSGGSVGSYVNNETYTYTIYPTAGSKLKVVFNSFTTENNWDGLLIYNGNSTGAPLLSSGLGAGNNAATCPAGSYRGTTSPGTIVSTAADGSLTFKFTSDGSVIAVGWDANVTCVTVPVISSFTPTSTCSGTYPVVTLTGTNFTAFPVTSVLFNGVSAAFTVNSNTSITTTLPASATTGYISVANAQATGLSTTMFSINPTPVAPNAGSNATICSGGSTTLLGTSSGVVNTVLSQNFNAGSWPTGWSRTINGGYSPGDFRTTSEFFSGGNTWAGNGYTGFCSYFYSYLIAGSTSGDMITTSMDLSTYTSSSLTFWIYNSAGTDALTVYANNNGGAYALLGTYTTYGSWTQITVNLNAYVGAGFNTVRLKFTGTSDSGSSNIGVDDIVVTGSITASYLWSPSTGLSANNILTPVASPTSTINYTLTTSFPSGCSATSAPITITVNPKPTVTITTPAASVCGNSVIPVSVSGTATSYIWTSTLANTLYSDSIASILYVPGTNTSIVYVKSPSTVTITATGTNATGCTNTSSVLFTVDTKTYNSSGLWNPAGPPTGTENIVFNSAWPGGSLSGCSCTVNVGASVFNAGDTLNLTNGITVAGGSVTFNDGASLVQTNNVANTGNIIYKRTANGINGYDYIYWSSPVLNQVLNSLYSTPLPGNKYQWNTLATNSNSPLTSGNWENAATSMDKAIGYIVRGSSNYYFGPGPITSVFTGVPNNGDIAVGINRGTNQTPSTVVSATVTVTNLSDNWNLLGNPYPSAISCRDFLTLNSSVLTGALYIWTHGIAPTNLANSPYYQSYTYNYNPNDYVAYNLTGNIATGNPDYYIGSGQGFFVTMKDGPTGSASVAFNNSLRNVAYGNASGTNFFRTAATRTSTDATLEFNRIWLDLVKDTQTSVRTLFGYVTGATMEKDNLHDAPIRNDNNLKIYTIANEEEYTIQGRSLPFDTADQVAVGIVTLEGGEYKIAIGAVDGLFENQNQGIYLQDNLTGVVHDLRLAPYTFTANAGTFTNRFVVRYTNAALGIDTPVFNDNTVVVFKNTAGLHINSGSIPMGAVEIYDIRGRQLATQKNIGASQISFTALPMTNQVLLVKITSEDGVVVTKKVVY